MTSYKHLDDQNIVEGKTSLNSEEKVLMCGQRKIYVKQVRQLTKEGFLSKPTPFSSSNLQPINKIRDEVVFAHKMFPHALSFRYSHVCNIFHKMYLWYYTEVFNS